MHDGGACVTGAVGGAGRGDLVSTLDLDDGGTSGKVPSFSRMATSSSSG